MSFTEVPLGKQKAKSAISCLSEPPTKKVCQNDIDLLNPPAELDKRKHELKHLVQSPDSFSKVLRNDMDLLNPLAELPELEKRTHKLKRVVQSRNYFFMDVKCQDCWYCSTTICSHPLTGVDVKCQCCFNITSDASHSQTVVVCGNCQTVLCQQVPGYKKKSETVEMSKLLAVEDLDSQEKEEAVLGCKEVERKVEEMPRLLQHH